MSLLLLLRSPTSGVPETPAALPQPEGEKLRAMLEDIRRFLEVNQERDERWRTVLLNRIAHFQETSERLGRKDWINLVLSVVSGAVVGLALPPDAARALFELVGTVLGEVAAKARALP